VFLAAVTVKLNQLQANRQNDPTAKEFFQELANRAQDELNQLSVSLKIGDGNTPAYQPVNVDRLGVTEDQKAVQQQNIAHVEELIQAAQRARDAATAERAIAQQGGRL
jgi:hypothetical protein